jgi:2-oxoglutarate ferredoxin oxidoreductase subunit beta
MKPEIVSMADYSLEDLWIHDSSDQMKATILSRMFDNNALEGGLPRPFGVFYQEDRFRYEDSMQEQLDKAVSLRGEGDLDALIQGSHTWIVD